MSSMRNAHDARSRAMSSGCNASGVGLVSAICLTPWLADWRMGTECSVCGVGSKKVWLPGPGPAFRSESRRTLDFFYFLFLPWADCHVTDQACPRRRPPPPLAHQAKQQEAMASKPKISFGLKKVEAPSKPQPLATASKLSLGDDDDDDIVAKDPSQGPRGSRTGPPASRASKQKQQQALELDSAVFDYDGVYDRMKAAERETARQKQQDNQKRDVSSAFVSLRRFFDLLSASNLSQSTWTPFSSRPRTGSGTWRGPRRKRSSGSATWRATSLPAPRPLSRTHTRSSSRRSASRRRRRRARRVCIIVGSSVASC